MNPFERRQYKRFKAAPGTYAVLGTEATSKLGQIKNISMGGLAFKYLADEARDDDADKLDIIIRQNGFYVKHIAIRTVSDFELALENAFSTVILRQQGVQFSDLTSEQRSQLEYILKHYTS
ncbi:MAG: PilZ domain-containing protein [Deltaproteobacteria bacterium]|nr:PilZ domain-containing protein [Deltaproteobacteria bacterium]